MKKVRIGIFVSCYDCTNSAKLAMFRSGLQPTPLSLCYWVMSHAIINQRKISSGMWARLKMRVNLAFARLNRKDMNETTKEETASRAGWTRKGNRKTRRTNCQNRFELSEGPIRTIVILVIGLVHIRHVRLAEIVVVVVYRRIRWVELAAIARLVDTARLVSGLRQIEHRAVTAGRCSRRRLTSHLSIHIAAALLVTPFVT